MQNNSQNNKNYTISNNEETQDINLIREQSTKILTLMGNHNNFYQYYEEFESDQEKLYSKNNNNTYYLISFKWLRKFSDFCYENKPIPGEIDNNNLIIKDISALKTEKDINLFYDLSLEKFQVNIISVVSKEIWIKLKNLFGGGPEYELVYQPDKKRNNFIKEGVRINLLFIKNKIKKIKENFKLDDFIKIKYIYFDLNDNVTYLKEYINEILQENKDEFFSNDKHKYNNDNIKENINYRLWLYTTYFGNAKVLATYILSKLTSLKRNNILFNENNLIDWTKFGKIGVYDFQIIPLSFFEQNIIKDIFPNKYTDYFDYKNEFQNLKNEEEHHFPYFTIIIEEAPFTLMTEEILYRLGICEKCGYKQITYCACECNNCFFCLKSCENSYKLKKNTHYINCKIHIMNELSKENKNYYHKTKSIFSLIGLVNLGNTCYMNSSLQCLRSIKELSEYFSDYFDENHLNKNNIIGTGGFLALAYANYIFKTNLNDTNFLELKNFRYAIGIVDDRFAGIDQQDTHEFLTFLIDSIHEDLNKVIIKPQVKRKSSEWEKKLNSKIKLDKIKSESEWNNFLKRNQSIMVDLFYGQFKTTISCPKCFHDSVNFSSFLSLQLPIPINNTYFTIKVCLYEEWLNTNNFICFEIILCKNNCKVFVAKKIIGKIFRISPYQIEIYKPSKSEVNKVYDDEEELTPNNMIKAVKINLKTIKNIDNTFSQDIIDTEDLPNRIKEQMDEYIAFIKNLNNDSNNYDDDCDVIIDINDDNINEITKINYEAYSLQKFIIKHYPYYLDKKTISSSIIHKDYLIYTTTNQSCYDLYFQFFLVYFSIIMDKELGIEQIKDLDELDKNRDEIKIYFDKLFKNCFKEENKSEEDIFDKYPDLPFFLKLKLYKGKTNKYIPNSKNLKFQKFINIQIENENKNNKTKNKSKEEQKSEEEKAFVSIEINNSKKPKDDNSLNNDKTNDEKIYDDPNYDYNPLKPEQGTNINLGKENFTGSKMDLVLNEKENTNKIQNSNNVVHTISIIFNPKYLKLENNGDYKITNISLQKIDLTSLFKAVHQNIEKIPIKKCFEEFTKMQTLDENNLYKCPKCKQNIAANNKIELYQLPNILIIQLKRFEKGQKMKTFIDFPLEDLDISQFLSKSSPNISQQLINYDLFAVSNHYGELEFGHYNANCLNYMDNQWYNFNDRKVEIIEGNNPELIVTKDAYVLFYRQKNMKNINWVDIYKKQFMDIKDDNFLDNINELMYRSNIKNTFTIKTGVIELNEEEDEKEESSLSEEISLKGFVYNPFNNNYLKLKRKRMKKKYIKK